MIAPWLRPLGTVTAWLIVPAEVAVVVVVDAPIAMVTVAPEAKPEPLTVIVLPHAAVAGPVIDGAPMVYVAVPTLPFASVNVKVTVVGYAVVNVTAGTVKVAVNVP